MRSNHWWRWVILAGLTLAVIFIPIPVGASVPTERTIRIEASRFEYSPAILNVNLGDHVTIEFMATDVVHGISAKHITSAHPAVNGLLTKIHKNMLAQVRMALTMIHRICMLPDVFSSPGVVV